MDPIEKLYQEARGKWTGIHWSTEEGPAMIDVEGWRSEDLLPVARALQEGEIDLDVLEKEYGIVADGDEYADQTLEGMIQSLFEAVEYCEAVERSATLAEKLAGQAMEAYRAGDIWQAVKHIRKAASVECKYGCAVTWGALEEALEKLHQEDER